MNKNVCPIVLITDENYVKPTAVTIASILASKKRRTNYKIYILANSLTLKSKRLLSEIKEVTVIPYKNVFAEFAGTHVHVSAAALLKFNICDIFKQYDKILYLDTDMIIQHDLSELFNIDIADKYAAVVKDMAAMFNKAHERLHLNNYFNSGMMLLNIKKMREDDISHKLLDYKKHKDAGIFMDQDCLNAVFNEKVKFLSCKYNYMPINQSIFSEQEVVDFYGISNNDVIRMDSIASVIHLTSKRKPWDFLNVYGADLWKKYYKKSIFKHVPLKYKEDVSDTYIYKNGKILKKRRILNNFHMYLPTDIFKTKLLFSEVPDDCLYGFYEREIWGRWSSGYRSMIVLPVQKKHRDIKISFVLRALGLELGIEQKVKVFVDGKFITEWLFNKKQQNLTPEISLSGKKLDKVIKIEFYYSNPISPNNLYKSDDTRLLSIGFESMMIE